MWFCEQGVGFGVRNFVICWLGDFRCFSFEGFYCEGYWGLNEFVFVKYLLQSFIVYKYLIKGSFIIFFVFYNGL